MKPHPLIPLLRALLLALFLALGACQSGPSQQASSDSSESTLLTPDLEASSEILTPTEEDIILAFQYESEQKWLEAAVLYDRLTQSSVQPERSAFLIKVGLMYYQGGLYDEIDPFFDALDEQDILQQDLKNKQVIQAGGYLGDGKIYQSLLALPEIDEVIDYRFKALALNIRSRGVLAIGKPLESAGLRMAQQPLGGAASGIGAIYVGAARPPTSPPASRSGHCFRLIAAIC